MKRCVECHRPVWNERSMIRGRGPVCHTKHLAETGQSATAPERMALDGYTTGKLGNGQYVVNTPEGLGYVVDIEEYTCDCESWTMTLHRTGEMFCKHIVFAVWDNARREALRQQQAEAKAERERERQERAARKAAKAQAVDEARILEAMRYDFGE